MYKIGVDIGGTKIAVGLVSSVGKVIDRIIEPTVFYNQEKGTIQQIIRMINSIRSRNKDKKVVSIGVGCPGPLDPHKGIIYAPPNMKGWNKVYLGRELRKHFKNKIVIDNDANAAALAEWKFGAGKGTKDMIYLTISTGVGSGIIIDGRLYRGLGSAGELGHCTINYKNGPKCKCGLRGCLEAYISGTSLISEAKKKKYKKSLIYKIAKKGNKISPAIIFQVARKGDKIAKEIITKACEAFAFALINIIHTFHPEKIILGGGIMKDADLIIPAVRKIITQYKLKGFQGSCQIAKARLGDNIGIIGAAELTNLNKNL